MDGVLIIECLDDGDPGSEGRFLAHMFKLMEVPHQYVEIHTRAQFLAMLATNPYYIAHIATHGYIPDKKFDGFWTPDNIVGLQDLDADTLKGRSVVSTACCSGAAHFRRKFIDRVACNYAHRTGEKPEVP